MFENEKFSQFIRGEAKRLREKDRPPQSLEAWKNRKQQLREQMFAAMGAFPKETIPLESKLVGILNRDGYRIEKRLLQTRPEVWMTSTVYLPEIVETEKVPAVLVVHGHWAWARRDPVVQARCIGLAKLGFLVMAVDAFGAGERFTNPAKGTYHGALYGSTLWPIGQSLLGMQVYDNRRAVDYLLSRPEVNGKLGITGASGGGNQTMYAGALDERFDAVVPVCSVGNYQAYLRTACCVCEVLPGALQFTEEGEVLGLVAPRALLVINATKDGIQFSPEEATKSVTFAKSIFETYSVGGKIRHQLFQSPHDYNQAMREAMYGWMTLHLKGVGKGEAIPEPKHTLEKPEDLACFPDPEERGKSFYFPPSFAFAEAKRLRTASEKLLPDHAEMWQANAMLLNSELKKSLGELPQIKMPKEIPFGEVKAAESRLVRQFNLPNERETTLPVDLWTKKETEPLKGPIAILLHLGGRPEATKSPLMEMVEKGYTIFIPELRATGGAKLSRDAVAGASDHNSAEHSVWLGRSLLNQWLTEIGILLDFLESRTPKAAPPLLVGFDHAGAIAILGGALFGERIRSVLASNCWSSFASETVYASGTPMGLLHPGLLKAGDLPHFASLIAPRPLSIVNGVTPGGKKLTENEIKEAFAFTRKVYEVLKASEKLSISVS
jgi:dienelactone hydrolase